MVFSDDFNKVGNQFQNLQTKTVLKLKLADMDKDYDAVLKIRRHLKASALKSSLKPISAFFPVKVPGLQG